MFAWDSVKQSFERVMSRGNKLLVSLGSELETSETNPRIRVDVGQTGFFEGREFRSFLEFNIAAGATQVIKFVSPIDFILSQQTLSLESGAIRGSIVAVGGTVGGTFNVALPTIGKNRMVDRPLPYYVPQITLSTGGTHTGGTEVEVILLSTANATAQQSTVGAIAASERGLPAGTYYIRLTNTGAGAAKGVYTAAWEERP